MTRRQAARWIEAYLAAWRSNAPADIESLFTPEAVYCVKRILMVLAVALMVAVMMVAMVAPAISKNIRPEPGGDAEPPGTSGNFPTFVFRCNTEFRAARVL